MSHDRYFLNRVCTAILAFEGVLRYSVGNYDYYREKRAAEMMAAATAPGKAQPPPPLAVTNRRKLKWKEERELEGMDTAILAAEDEVARIEALFIQPEFFATRVAENSEARDGTACGRAKVARLYARWEELQAIAEAAVA